MDSAPLQVLYRSRRENYLRRAVLSLAMLLFMYLIAARAFNGVTALLVVLGLGLVMVAAEIYTGTRSVLFDADGRNVIVEWKNLFFQRRRKSFPLKRFHSIISYYSEGRNPGNSIFIAEPCGWRGLQIACYPHRYRRRHFLDIFPKLIEAEEAAQLRGRLHSILGLHDKGFIGIHPHPDTL